jgi:hypothetical protein
MQHDECLGFGESEHQGFRIRNRTDGSGLMSSAGFWGDANMAEYRAYITDKDGLISRAIGLVCPDDETAMEYAKQFVEGHDVELWQHDCRIATFKHKA